MIAVLAVAVSLTIATALTALWASQGFAQQGQDEGQRSAIDHAPGGAPYASGELIINFERDSGIVQADALENLGPLGGAADFKVEQSLPALDAQLISLPQLENEQNREARERTLEQTRSSLEASPLIESVEYNYLRQPTAAPNDPGFDRQYGLRQINAPQAWDTTRGAGAEIAVVDTGIDDGHPDLRGKLSGQYDYVNGDREAEESIFGGGHGTHVSGIAAADTNNGAGVAGSCYDCSIFAAKAQGNFGGTDSDIARAITGSTDRGAEVINLSLGGPARSDLLERAVEYARSRDSLPVAAAGNSGDSTVNYPAGYSEVVAVAATDSSDRRASYSSTGSFVDVAAPGSNVLSTVPGGYGEKSGTSMASPHAAGVAGLLASQGLSANQIEQRLLATAVDKGPDGDDPFYGAGRVDAEAAVGGP